MKPKLAISSDGTKKWRLNGKLHREDGPAVENSNGSKVWYLNGQRHREDGPAEEWPDGYKFWYLNDTELTKRQLTSKKMKIDHPEIYNNYLKMKSELIISSDGTKSWWLNGEYHREDGPAVEEFDGTKSWWLNGKLHREDGPALKYLDGSKYWYLNGKRHREDGPAVEEPSGYIEWYLNGKQLYEKELTSKKIKIDYPEIYNSYLVYKIMGS